VGGQQWLLVHVLAPRRRLSREAWRKQGDVAKDRQARLAAGLVAFDGDLAVGWCQLTPRDELAWLDRMRWFHRIDDVPVWSISCFFVRRAYRRQGVMSQLIDAALKTAKRAKAPALEAYPVDTTAPKSTSNIFTGTISAFAHAGFKEMRRLARSCATI